MLRIGVGDDTPQLARLRGLLKAPEGYLPRAATKASDLSLLYFTSGTTARPKLVAHTQVSYPVGHLFDHVVARGAAR